MKHTLHNEKCLTEQVCTIITSLSCTQEICISNTGCVYHLQLVPRLKMYIALPQPQPQYISWHDDLYIFPSPYLYILLLFVFREGGIKECYIKSP